MAEVSGAEKLTDIARPISRTHSRPTDSFTESLLRTSAIKRPNTIKANALYAEILYAVQTDPVRVRSVGKSGTFGTGTVNIDGSRREEPVRAVPLSTGSAAELYIQPPLSCVDDRDIMLHFNNELVLEISDCQIIDAEVAGTLRKSGYTTGCFYRLLHDPYFPAFVYILHVGRFQINSDGNYVITKDTSHVRKAILRLIDVLENVATFESKNELSINNIGRYNCEVDTIYGLYICNDMRGRLVNQRGDDVTSRASAHGPAAEMFGVRVNEQKRNHSEVAQQEESEIMYDYVPCLHLPVWPESIAKSWVERVRNSTEKNPSYLTAELLEEVMNAGCDVVGKAHADCADELTNLQFRLSFSRAEVLLMRSWSVKQQLVYHLLRWLRRRALKEPDGILCNYHLKTLILWTCEEQSKDWWEQESLVEICSDLLMKLADQLQSRDMKNYFIVNSDLFGHSTLNQQRLNEMVKKLRAIAKRETIQKWYMENYIEYLIFQELDANSGTLYELYVRSRSDHWTLDRITALFWLRTLASIIGRDRLDSAKTIIDINLRWPLHPDVVCFCKAGLRDIDESLKWLLPAITFLQVADKVSSLKLENVVKGLDKFDAELSCLDVLLTGTEVHFRKYRNSSFSVLSLETEECGIARSIKFASETLRCRANGKSKEGDVSLKLRMALDSNEADLCLFAAVLCCKREMMRMQAVSGTRLGRLLNLVDWLVLIALLIACENTQMAQMICRFVLDHVIMNTLDSGNFLFKDHQRNQPSTSGVSLLELGASAPTESGHCMKKSISHNIIALESLQAKLNAVSEPNALKKFYNMIGVSYESTSTKPTSIMLSGDFNLDVLLRFLQIRCLKDLAQQCNITHNYQARLLEQCESSWKQEISHEDRTFTDFDLKLFSLHEMECPSISRGTDSQGVNIRTIECEISGKEAAEIGIKDLSETELLIEDGLSAETILKDFLELRKELTRNSENLLGEFHKTQTCQALDEINRNAKLSAELELQEQIIARQSPDVASKRLLQIQSDIWLKEQIDYSHSLDPTSVRSVYECMQQYRLDNLQECLETCQHLLHFHTMCYSILGVHNLHYPLMAVQPLISLWDKEVKDLVSPYDHAVSDMVEYLVHPVIYTLYLFVKCSKMLRARGGNFARGNPAGRSLPASTVTDSVNEILNTLDKKELNTLETKFICLVRSL